MTHLYVYMYICMYCVYVHMHVLCICVSVYVCERITECICVYISLCILMYMCVCSLPSSKYKQNSLGAPAAVSRVLVQGCDGLCCRTEYPSLYTKVPAMMKWELQPCLIDSTSTVVSNDSRPRLITSQDGWVYLSSSTACALRWPSCIMKFLSLLSLISHALGGRQLRLTLAMTSLATFKAQNLFSSSSPGKLF